MANTIAEQQGQLAVAILDDYQDVSLAMADWGAVRRHASITVFGDHIADDDRLVERLLPFDIVCVMRERTPLPERILARLPRLKLIASTGIRNASVDVKYAESRGIAVLNTGYTSSPTVELTWALILCSTRHLIAENASLRSGGWQMKVGVPLYDQVLGVVGLGNVGSRVAAIAKSFGMKVIAWSPNLTEERATAAGAHLVSKQELFERSDIVSVHMVLGPKTRGLIGDEELTRMKPTAYLVNTSRGPLVDEASLIRVLADGRISGAAIDVFDQEPLPSEHPFRSMDSVLATPHIGYVSRDLYRIFYGDTARNVSTWLESYVRQRRSG